MLLVNSDSLLSAGVARMLESESDLKVVNFNYSDEASLEQNVEKFHPEIIILDEDIKLLNLTKVLELLIHYPNLRILTLSLKNNRANVFTSHNVFVRHIGDLIAIIRESQA